MVDYSGRKILVTGGTGFIGGRLAERLAVEQQASVRVLVHDWRKAIWVSRADVELVQGDVRDSHAVAQAMRGCDLVFHCVGVGGTLDQCMSINCEGTRNVLESAMTAHVERVVYLSTIAVHGPNPPSHMDENDDFRMTGSPYGDSKIAAEKLIWQFWQERHLPVVVLRPVPVWGPRSPSFTLWPINRMKIGQWFLVDRGRGACHAVYVDNLVDALLLAGVRPTAVGEAFLITDERPCTWAEFFGYYARMLEIRLPSVRSDIARFALPAAECMNRVLAKLEHTPAHEPARFVIRSLRRGLRPVPRLIFPAGALDRSDVRKYAWQGEFNASKARAVLGYRARISMQEGMRETEAWLRDQRII